MGRGMPGARSRYPAIKSGGSRASRGQMAQVGCRGCGWVPSAGFSSSWSQDVGHLRRGRSRAHSKGARPLPPAGLCVSAWQQHQGPLPPCADQTSVCLGASCPGARYLITKEWPCTYGLDKPSRLVPKDSVFLPESCSGSPWVPGGTYPFIPGPPLVDGAGALRLLLLSPIQPAAPPGLQRPHHHSPGEAHPLQPGCPCCPGSWTSGKCSACLQCGPHPGW